MHSRTAHSRTAQKRSRKWLPKSSLALALLLPLCFLYGLPSTAMLPAVAHAGSEHSAIQKRISRLIPDEDYTAIGNCFDQLAALSDAQAIKIIFKTMEVIPPEEVLDKFIEVFKRLPVEVTGEAVDEYLKKKRKHPLVASAILIAAVEMPDDRSAGWAVSQLRSKTDLIFRNALDCSLKRKLKAAIPVLIELLDDVSKKNRMRRMEIEDGLYELTAQQFEFTEDWSKWWDTAGDSFDPKKAHAEGEGKTGVLKRKRDKDNPEFFGVEIVSNKVMFVVDKSGSMQYWDKGGGEEGSSRSDEFSEGRRRINRVKQQLAAAIRKLSKGSQFNVVAFSDRIIVLNPKGLVPATGKWKKKGVDFAKGLSANGTTHTDDALAKAFEDKKIDTIVLLTDGQPVKQNAGNLIPQILEDTRRRNKLRKIKIFTFGFDGAPLAPPGQQDPPAGDYTPLTEFLKKLAGDNYGKYTSIR